MTENNTIFWCENRYYSLFTLFHPRKKQIGIDRDATFKYLTLHAFKKRFSTLKFFKTKRGRFLLPAALNTWSKWSRQWVTVPPGQTGCRWDLQGRCRPRWRCSCQSEHPTRCKATKQQLQAEQSRNAHQTEQSRNTGLGRLRSRF